MEPGHYALNNVLVTTSALQSHDRSWSASDSIVSALLAAMFALATLLPLHERPLASFYNDWIAIVGVAVAFILIARTRGAPLRIPSGALYPGVLLLIILGQAATGLLPMFIESLIPAAYLLMAILAMVIGATLSGRSEGRAALCRALASGYLGAALVSVGLAIGQTVGADLPFIFYPDGPTPLSRPYGNMGQPNHLALLLCLGVASAAYLYRKGRLPAGLALLFVMMLLGGLVLTQSRTGILMLLALFVLTIWYERDNESAQRIPFAVLACLMLLFAAAMYALPPLLEQLRPGQTVGGQGETSRLLALGPFSTRLVLLQQSLDMIMMHPWTGIGWGQFTVHQFDLTLAHPLVEKSNHSHNLAVNLIAELGIPIGVVACLLLLVWLFRLLQGARRGMESGFVFAVVLVVAIHSMFEYPLWYAYMLLPVAVLAGAAPEKSAPNYWFISGVKVLLIGLIAAAGLYWAQYDYQTLRAESSALRSEVRSGVIRPVTPESMFTLFPHLKNFISLVRTPPRAGMTSDELAIAANTISRFPAPAAIERLSTMYALNDRDEDAIRIATILRKTHPCSYLPLYKAWARNAARMPEQWERRFGALPPPAPGQC